MNKPVIILGAGGHAKVLIDSLLCLNAKILGMLDLHPDMAQQVIGVPVIGDDDNICRYDAREIMLVNGMGSVSSSTKRRDLFTKFTGMGYFFRNVIHPSAVVSATALLGQGVQIMAGSVIQPGVVLGNNVLINSRASVDHDCHIGDHSHIAPGATLSGGVRIGEGTHIGAGATIIQGVTVGRSCTVAAGAVIICDVPDDTTIAGVPGRIIKGWHGDIS